MDNKVIVRLTHGYFNGGVETLPEACPTIDAHIGCWHILIGEKMNDNRFFKQAFETAQENECSTGDTIDAYNKKVNQSGTSPYVRQDGIVGTLTTDGSSPKHNNRIIENLRIRKITPKECGRLMGVRDKDIDTIAVNQSNSSQYHLYGDSIVVDVLMAIFGQML